MHMRREPEFRLSILDFSFRIDLSAGHVNLRSLLRRFPIKCSIYWVNVE